MAGETIKSEAICLSIIPWSKTSHVVAWLTPHGKITTVVKGAVRPKSAFLGQYDLNYTCEILYYARAKGDLHALRECVPIERRDELRDDYRSLAFAGYVRYLIERLVPQGPEAEEWYELLSRTLGALPSEPSSLLPKFLSFELEVLHLLGLEPEIEAESGGFFLRGERSIPVSKEVADYLRHPRKKSENLQIPLDAARVIGVFYQFHVDLPVEVRRTTLGLITRM